MTSPDSPDPSAYLDSSRLWYLDGLTDEGRRVRRIPILALPFLIGRLPGKGLTLSSQMISGRHAEIYEEDGALKLRDLGSTNGTSHNGDRVEGSVELAVGDIVHFAKLEFRLGRSEGGNAGTLLIETMAVDAELPEPVVAKSRLLRQMMRDRSMTAVFQPIVDLADGTVFGYESLGRGDLAGSSIGVPELFKAATVLAAEADLSRLLREESVSCCRRVPAGAALFINTHPKEIGTSELARSLLEFRTELPDRSIVVEVHEASVTDPATIRRLRETLTDLGMRLAYDDFGAGQTRLLELTEAPPDFLKFDLSMVRDLENASPERRQLTARLVSMAGELGIATLAEGIEEEEGARACRELGFDYAQGFLYGKPLPVAGIEKRP